jgi:hypothetical protein
MENEQEALATAGEPEILKMLRDQREAFKTIKAKRERFPKTLQAFGELAIETAQLEGELTITVSELISSAGDPKAMNLDVVDIIAHEKRSFPALAELAKKLFDAHIKDPALRKPFHEKLVGHVSKWLPLGRAFNDNDFDK